MSQLEFIDCPYCGKRVASTAKRCRHCGNSPKGKEDSGDDSEVHFAASSGGYDVTEDDFDYDEYLAEEFPESEHQSQSSNRWKYVSILLLLVFALLFLVQLF